jgi:hypothetical protein
MVKPVITEEFDFAFQMGNGKVTLVNSLPEVAKAKSKKILVASATFAISEYTGGAINVSKSGQLASFTFTATAQKTKHKGEVVLLNEDKAQVVIAGSNSSSGAVTQPDVVTIKAKQDKVKGC